MKNDLVVDDLCASPGERTKGFVVVDTTASGTQVRVPVILINGAGEGPTLVVTSGVHGDDLNTIPMVWRVAESVDPADLSGQIIAIPICNPPAFEAGSHLSPADNKSLSFPGNAQGTISERMGYHLYHKIVVQADYLMDMHGGSVRSTLAALVVVDFGAEEETVEAAKAMAEAFNPDLIIEGRPKGGMPPTAMFQITSRNGKPGLLIGMGKMGFNESDTVRGARGVLNVLRHLDMLEGDLELVATPRYTSVEVYHYTPFGGGFFPAVDVGQEVEEGQTLGTVFSVFGESSGEVKSEVSGMVAAIRFYPVVGAGEWVASIAKFE